MTQRRKKPLCGRTIVVTRPKGRSSSLRSRLESLGAEVVLAPSIRLSPPRSWSAVDAAIRRLDGYWGIVFTSVTAVEAFCRRMAAPSGLRGRRVFAVGPATAEAARRFGARVRLLPVEATVGRLASMLSRVVPDGARLLHPCADLANPVLRRTLSCDDVVVYRIRPEGRAVFLGRFGRADLLTFTSSETVRRFSDRIDPRTRRVPAVCIGPLTAKTAREAGFRVAGTARPHTEDGLIRAVRRVFR